VPALICQPMVSSSHVVVVFERFIDVAFPSRSRAGSPNQRSNGPAPARSRVRRWPATSTSGIHDASPNTESLENVWTALSGQVRPVVLADPGLRAVFGTKDKMRLEVTSAIKFGPRVDTLDKLITLIRWLAATAESPLPDDDDWAILDSIKVLNPRKSKDLIARLKRDLAEKLVVTCAPEFHCGLTELRPP
jgi:hypothetical protein